LLWANPLIAAVIGALFGGLLVSGGNDTSEPATPQDQTLEATSSETFTSENAEHDTPS